MVAIVASYIKTEAEAPTTAAALYSPPSTGPVMITAIVAHNTNAAARTANLYITTDGTTFDATTLIYTSGTIAASTGFARLWFEDVPLVLKPGETLGVVASGGDVAIHVFGVTDLQGFRG